ncbi:flagellar assembly protein A [Massilia sp. LXY-6]|uniref:flagellar assembly protein A n=1 Tax=Massilia sp. LXY-6 TaxID=3379823 RepID=UPI003EE28BAA
MSTDFAAAPAQAQAARFTATGPEHCIDRRPDGVHADPAVLGTTLVAAIDGIFRGGHYLAAIDYPILLKALFDHGPALPKAADGSVQARIAAAILPFDPARRELYRSVKIGGGRAEYYFEPVWLPDPADPDGPGVPARLDLDEFIADMWLKGIRFGIDLDAVRSAIDTGKAERVTVARRLDPEPGQDARIVEVSDDIHRNDAPRQLADGRLDLNSFQNRFPQIQPGVRLLQKVPLSIGRPGFEMSGAPLAPKPGSDFDLGEYAGEGTKVERLKEGEFLVSQQAGFLSVEPSTSRISVGDKIVSRDGVSAKTTGNLQLSGDYEEFGEVQEKRVIEGEGITVHGDVFGELVSRGGTILLHANLVGGSAHNKRGDIRVRGVASGAVLQAEDGAVVLERAENCVVSGTRVTIGHAVNCEVIGDEVNIGHAEGSAVAGRRVTVDFAMPRKQGEMLVYVLRPEGAQVEEIIAAIGARLARCDELAAQHKAQMDALTAQPEVRRYLMLASRVRKNEISFTPEQARQFQRMGQNMAPALKAIGEVSGKLKQLDADREEGRKLLADLERQRGDAASAAAVTVHRVQGDTLVRVLGFSPAASSPYIIAPREARARLRGPQSGELLFSGAQGSFSWSSEQASAA